MTLDEAIKHAEEVAERQEKYCPTPEDVVDNHKKCAKEHRQLAEWLTDYKRLLEQEPCDAISRQAVLDTLNNTDKFMDEDRTVETYKALLKECYEVLPPVTPKQRTGHWIDTADEINAKYGKHDYKCSKCGKYAERFIAGTEDWWSCVKPNYCLSCGTAMTESEGAE